jgi:nicotinate phosphoribosyltransferase
MSASRAAYIGGVNSTSNVLAGKVYGIPLKGTHAHSWIMSFPSEPEAFDAFAEVMPNNCVFLVDTYNTIDGVKNAIKAGEKLKARGHKMLGIRLDSGDLSAFSIEARKLMDAAGLKDADIVASNDLDEYAIEKLKAQGSKINVWGVGTRLVTAHDQPALGGVYKVSALKENGAWVYKIKFSDDAIKVSNPGVLQVRRTKTEDVIYNIEDHELGPEGEDLLVPIFRQGKPVYREPDIKASRESAQSDLKKLDEKYRKISKATENYPVRLEKKLDELKTSLIRKASGKPQGQPAS